MGSAGLKMTFVTAAYLELPYPVFSSSGKKADLFSRSFQGPHTDNAFFFLLPLKMPPLASFNSPFCLLTREGMRNALKNFFFFYIKQDLCHLMNFPDKLIVILLDGICRNEIGKCC